MEGSPRRRDGGGGVGMRGGYAADVAAARSFREDGGGVGGGEKGREFGGPPGWEWYPYGEGAWGPPPGQGGS